MSSKIDKHVKEVKKCLKKIWTVEEDELLRLIVNDRGKSNWDNIAREMSTGRKAKHCRERWYNHLDDSLYKGDWTKEEDELIMEFQSQHGNQWSKIASILRVRADVDVKNRFKKLQRSGSKINADTNVLDISNSTKSERRPHFSLEVPAECANEYLLSPNPNKTPRSSRKSTPRSSVAIIRNDEISDDSELWNRYPSTNLLNENLLDLLEKSRSAPPLTTNHTFKLVDTTSYNSGDNKAFSNVEIFPRSLISPTTSYSSHVAANNNFILSSSDTSNTESQRSVFSDNSDHSYTLSKSSEMSTKSLDSKVYSNVEIIPRSLISPNAMYTSRVATKSSLLPVLPPSSVDSKVYSNVEIIPRSLISPNATYTSRVATKSSLLPPSSVDSKVYSNVEIIPRSLISPNATYTSHIETNNLIPSSVDTSNTNSQRNVFSDRSSISDHNYMVTKNTLLTPKSNVSDSSQILNSRSSFMYDKTKNKILLSNKDESRLSHPNCTDNQNYSQQHNNISENTYPDKQNNPDYFFDKMTPTISDTTYLETQNNLLYSMSDKSHLERTCQLVYNLPTTIDNDYIYKPTEFSSNSIHKRSVEPSACFSSVHDKTYSTAESGHYIEQDILNVLASDMDHMTFYSDSESTNEFGIESDLMIGNEFDLYS